MCPHYFAKVNIQICSSFISNKSFLDICCVLNGIKFALLGYLSSRQVSISERLGFTIIQIQKCEKIRIQTHIQISRWRNTQIYKYEIHICKKYEYKLCNGLLAKQVGKARLAEYLKGPPSLLTGECSPASNKNKYTNTQICNYTKTQIS